QAIKEAGGTGLLVGGSVRDMLLGIEPKDRDCEVYGLEVNALLDILKRFGRVDIVGMSFGVIKLYANDGHDYDFSLPRRESKDGRGHRGFLVSSDPDMPIADAAARRDFTINSMAYDPLTDTIIDVYGGQADLRLKYLRATSEHFSEDPLRVLRGMQFCGRFDLIADLRTLKMCEALLDEYDTLAKERIWEEWKKWALKSTVPSRGLKFLDQTYWIEKYPQLAALQDVEQDRSWHPEGTAWLHSLHTVDAMVRLCERKHITGVERLVRIFAALCHDMGKPFTTEKGEDGRIRSIGHEKAGIGPTRSFLESIGCPEAIIEQVIGLVAEHMNYKGAMASKKALRKLAHRLFPATIRQLTSVVWADHAGRPPLPVDKEDMLAELLQRAEADGCADDVPEVVKGRHLLAIGWTPGVHMGNGLQNCYNAWLNGRFDTAEDGVRFAGKVQ
ncbi:partial Multifunctional CCA protein, partial [Anaerolineae bacterium]